MRSMEKLALRDPIAEFNAEELASAAALALDAQIARSNRQLMLRAIRSEIRSFDYENIEAQIMGEAPVWSPEAIFMNILYRLRRDVREYWREALA